MDINIYYVGQANFSIIVKDENALIYDCWVSKVSKWIEDDIFISNVERYLKIIYKKVKKYLIIISHTDDDHMNLHRSLKLFFKKYHIKNYEIIMDGNIETLNEHLKKNENFFDSQFKFQK